MRDESIRRLMALYPMLTDAQIEALLTAARDMAMGNVPQRRDCNE